MGISSKPSGRRFIRDSHAVFRSWVHVHHADKWGLDVKRENFTKAKLIIEQIDQCKSQIEEVRAALKGYIYLQMFTETEGDYKVVPVSQKRAKDFLSIVKQDLITEKAKLEKELEDL